MSLVDAHLDRGYVRIAGLSLTASDRRFWTHSARPDALRELARQSREIADELDRLAATPEQPTAPAVEPGKETA